MWSDEFASSSLSFGKLVVDVLVVQLSSLVFEAHAPLWSQAPLCCVKFPAGLWPHTNNNKKEKDKLISATEGEFVLVVEVAFPFSCIYIYLHRYNCELNCLKKKRVAELPLYE